MASSAAAMRTLVPGLVAAALAAGPGCNRGPERVPVHEASTHGPAAEIPTATAAPATPATPAAAAPLRTWELAEVHALPDGALVREVAYERGAPVAARLIRLDAALRRVATRATDPSERVRTDHGVTLERDTEPPTFLSLDARLEVAARCSVASWTARGLHADLALLERAPRLALLRVATCRVQALPESVARMWFAVPKNAALTRDDAVLSLDGKRLGFGRASAVLDAAGGHVVVETAVVSVATGQVVRRAHRSEPGIPAGGSFAWRLAGDDLTEYSTQTCKVERPDAMTPLAQVDERTALVDDGRILTGLSFRCETAYGPGRLVRTVDLSAFSQPRADWLSPVLVLWDATHVSRSTFDHGIASQAPPRTVRTRWTAGR
jgi:hypothetical protein